MIIYLYQCLPILLVVLAVGYGIYEICSVLKEHALLEEKIIRRLFLGALCSCAIAFAIVQLVYHYQRTDSVSDDPVYQGNAEVGGGTNSDPSPYCDDTPTTLSLASTHDEVSESSSDEEITMTTDDCISYYEIRSKKAHWEMLFCKTEVLRYQLDKYLLEHPEMTEEDQAGYNEIKNDYDLAKQELDEFGEQYPESRPTPTPVSDKPQSLLEHQDFYDPEPKL